MKEYKMSKEAMDICKDYGMKLMLTESEIVGALRNMTEDEFCRGDFYEVLDRASRNIKSKWHRLDLVDEYQGW